MSKEKFIRGKRDNGHHDGLYSNIKRLQEAEFQLTEFLSQPTVQTKTSTTPLEPKRSEAPEAK